MTKNTAEENKEPEISSRFDVEDIRRIREYNSLRHINMTATEIVMETRNATAGIVERLIKSGNVVAVVRA